MSMTKRVTMTFEATKVQTISPPLTCERPPVKGGHSKTSERPNVRLLLQEFIHDALGIVRMEKPATEKFTRRMPLGAWGLTIEETRAMRPGLTV